MPPAPFLIIATSKRSYEDFKNTELEEAGTTSARTKFQLKKDNASNANAALVLLFVLILGRSERREIQNFRAA